jgi:NO-binding membrane sensor protein with MHYT domain
MKIDTLGCLPLLVFCLVGPMVAVWGYTYFLKLHPAMMKYGSQTILRHQLRVVVLYVGAILMSYLIAAVKLTGPGGLQIDASVPLESMLIVVSNGLGTLLAMQIVVRRQRGASAEGDPSRD